MIIKEAGGAYSPIDYKNEKELQMLILEQPQLLRSSDGGPSLHSIDKEINTDAGSIDILLLDDSGKLVIVETKLAKNGESRRSVVAQIIDYLSALSQYSYYELNDATHNKLEETVLSMANPDATRKLIESNVRSGKVRLVIAVDESNDDLVRIMQFLSELTDFEIDLIEIKMHLFGEEKIYNSNIVIRGKETDSSQKRLEYADEILNKIQYKWNTEYKDLYPPIKNREKRYDYRQVHFPNWPSSLHYEFLKSSRTSHVEIRLDNEIGDARADLRDRLRDVMQKFAGSTVNGYTVEALKSRLVIKIDDKDVDNDACPTMEALIKKTFDAINAVIKENGA